MTPEDIQKFTDDIARMTKKEFHTMWSKTFMGLRCVQCKRFMKRGEQAYPPWSITHGYGLCTKCHAHNLVAARMKAAKKAKRVKQYATK